MAWLLTVRRTGGIWFWPLLLYLPAVLGAILLTSSRGGAIVTLLALLVIPLTMRSLDLPRRLAFWFVLGTAALGAIYAAPVVIDTVSSSLQRLSSTATEVASGTLNERAELWQAGLAAFDDAGWLVSVPVPSRPSPRTRDSRRCFTTLNCRYGPSCGRRSAAVRPVPAQCDGAAAAPA